MRKFTHVAMAGILGLGIAGIGGDAAQAAPCSPTSGYIEGWAGTNTCATFLWSYVWNIIPAGYCKALGSPNQTEYIWNNTAEQWRAWTGPGCSGSNAPLYAHTAGAMTGIWKDNIESVSRDN
jgi:hypothetical protein